MRQRHASSGNYYIAPVYECFINGTREKLTIAEQVKRCADNPGIQIEIGNVIGGKRVEIPQKTMDELNREIENHFKERENT